MAQAVRKPIISSPITVRLATFSLADLAVMYDAAHTAAAAWIAIANQPRTDVPAQHFIDAEWDRCNGIVDEIAKEVRRRKPVDADECERYAIVLLREASRGGDWKDCVAISTYAAAMADIEWRARKLMAA